MAQAPFASSIKLGRSAEINAAARRLADAIRSTQPLAISKNEFVVVASEGRYPIVARTLAQRVSEGRISHWLPLLRTCKDPVEGQRCFQHRDTLESRQKSLQPLTILPEAAREISGKRVLVVDDSVVSGAVLEALEVSLRPHGITAFQPYVVAIIDSQGNYAFESQVNRASTATLHSVQKPWQIKISERLIESPPRGGSSVACRTCPRSGSGTSPFKCLSRERVENDS